MSLLGEIKRRKVFQVAAVYAVVAWLVIQIIDVVSEPLNLPGWIDTVVIVLLAVGFPMAVILAWAFDLTPEGVVKDQGTVQSGGRGIEYALLGLIVVAIGWLFYRDISPSGETGIALLEVVEQEVVRSVLPNSVAVLPFENLSPNPDDEYFAAGVHEQIINELAKIRDLSVIARTSVMQYADAPPTIPEIANELKVETVMEGSVRYDGDQVRVTAQLIDGDTGLHIWSEDYDGDRADIFRIQSDIATQIAMALEAELSSEEQQRIEKVLTDSPEAYSLYLQATNLGVVIFDYGSGPNHELHRYLDAAIQLDPGFSRAYALKAYDYVWATLRAMLPDGPDVDELKSRAMENILLALSHDSEENLAYVAMANLFRFTWRATAAEAAYEKALQLAPNDYSSLQTFAHFLSFIEEFERAMELAERGLELDADPFGFSGLRAIPLRAGDFDAAFEAHNELLRVNPSVGWAHTNLAISEWHRGNEDSAFSSLENAERLISDSEIDALSALVHANGLVGRRVVALRLLDRLERIADTSHVRATDWARAYLGVGNYEQALMWLRRIDEDREPEDAIGAFEFAINSEHDPALERREFLEIRNRLALRR